MSQAPTTHVVPAGLLRRLGGLALRKCGVGAVDATLVADSLVESDLRGVPSHGIARLPWYVGRLRAGGDNPVPAIQVVSEGPSYAAIDGDQGLGQVVAQRAMSLAIEKASRTGVGIVTARNSHHLGACAYWAEMASRAGMIGIAISNGGPNMAPWGGTVPVTGNAPVAFSIPTANEPITLDMALSVVAGGRLDVAARAGEPIPLGWALDRDGVPTTDPAAGRAGSLLPIGEHKGAGLAVIFEFLTGVLSGANFGRNVPWPADDNQAMGVGHYLQAIRVEGFMPAPMFQERTDVLVRQVHEAGTRPGFGAVRLPGTPELETRASRVTAGVPMTQAEVAPLVEVAKRLGLRRLASELAGVGTASDDGWPRS